MNSVFHYRPRDSRLRRKWNRIIETEGAKLGLSGCRSFLEDKIVNDIFYEGLFKGRPCIVKCSSRAPDSMRTEYEMLKRVHDADACVFPEPFALWVSDDGRNAFVALEKIGGGTPSDPASDILRMAVALRSTGIVHRDVCMKNILCGADIDAGQASHFAPDDMESRGNLLGMADEMGFAAPVGRYAMFRIWIYYLSLCMQFMFSHKRSLKWRLYKIRRLSGLECGGMLSSLDSATDPSQRTTEECPFPGLGVAEQKVEAV